MKFYLMWANHNASMFWDKRIADTCDVQMWDSAVDRQEFEKIRYRVSSQSIPGVDGREQVILQPDGLNGYGYLEAVKRLFSDRKEHVKTCCHENHGG